MSNQEQSKVSPQNSTSPLIPPKFIPAPVLQPQGEAPAIARETLDTKPPQGTDSSPTSAANPLAEMFGHGDASGTGTIQRSLTTSAAIASGISSANSGVIQRKNSVQGETFYHATTSVAWASIQGTGLDPNYGGKGEGWSTTNDTMADSKGKVFFHRSIKMARDTAENLREREGSGGSVILAYTTEVDGELKEGGTMGGHWTDQLVPGDKLRPVETFEEKIVKTKKRCFLTTSCVQWRGLPDDCHELTVLREFRDGYLQGTVGGSQLIETYYRIAPGLVERIEQSETADATLAWIYEIVSQCVAAIGQGDSERAVVLYRGMVNRLLSDFPAHSDRS